MFFVTPDFLEWSTILSLHQVALIHRTLQTTTTDWLTCLLLRSNRLVLGVPLWASRRVSRHPRLGPRTGSWRRRDWWVVEPAESQEVGLMTCVRGERVQGVVTLICGGVAQTCHDDGVVCRAQGTARDRGRRRRKAGRTRKGRKERSSQRERAMDDMEMTMWLLRTWAVSSRAVGGAQCKLSACTPRVRWSASAICQRRHCCRSWWAECCCSRHSTCLWWWWCCSSSHTCSHRALP